MPLETRCSSLPIFMRCAQSVRGEVNVNDWYPEAGLGTAAHAYADDYVSGRTADVGQLAQLHGVDVADLEFLAGQVREAWKEIEAPYLNLDRNVSVEVPMSLAIVRDGVTLLLSGTPDVVIEVKESNDLVEVVDWKTGRSDSDYREQLIGYAAMALEKYPEASGVRARVLWLREMETEIYSLNRHTAAMWRERIADQALDQTYRPGPHCGHCPRRYSCQARKDMQSASVSMLAVVRPEDIVADGRRFSLEERPPEEQIDLYHRAKDVRDMAERVIQEMRHIVERQGPVSGNGVTLSIQVQNVRGVVPYLAWPILQKYLTDTALANSVTVYINKIEDGAAEQKPRGEGAQAKRAMLAELQQAGAIKIHQVRRLMEKRS